MKVITMPCAECHFPSNGHCEFCERYTSFLKKLKPDDFVIFDIVDSDKAVNKICPHCGEWMRFA